MSRTAEPKPVTTTATIEITCPHWCTKTPQRHADDLWNEGGVVLHTTAEVSIGDEGGITQGPLEDPTPVEPVEISMTTTTTPDGQPQGDPVVYFNDHELTIKQAEEIAAALLEVVRLARGTQA